MITVAQGGSSTSTADDYCYKYPTSKTCRGVDFLPMLLSIPRINDWRGTSVVLGLGDIVLPGFLVAYAARTDEAARLVGENTKADIYVPRKWYQGFHFPLCVAYGVGLIFANVAVALMQRGQPALLYLVPCLMGTFIVRARKELKQHWKESKAIRIADKMINKCERFWGRQRMQQQVAKLKRERALEAGVASEADELSGQEESKPSSKRANRKSTGGTLLSESAVEDSLPPLHADASEDYEMHSRVDQSGSHLPGAQSSSLSPQPTQSPPRPSGRGQSEGRGGRGRGVPGRGHGPGRGRGRGRGRGGRNGFQSSTQQCSSPNSSPLRQAPSNPADRKHTAPGRSPPRMPPLEPQHNEASVDGKNAASNKAIPFSPEEKQGDDTGHSDERPNTPPTSQGVRAEQPFPSSESTLPPDDEDICFGKEDHTGTKHFRRAVRKTARSHLDQKYGPDVYKAVKKQLKTRRFFKESSPGQWAEATKTDLIDQVRQVFEEEKTKLRNKS